MFFPGICVFSLFRFFAKVFMLQRDFITTNRKKICIYFNVPYGKDVLRSMLAMTNVIQATGIEIFSKWCEQHELFWITISLFLTHLPGLLFYKEQTHFDNKQHFHFLYFLSVPFLKLPTCFMCMLFGLFFSRSNIFFCNVLKSVFHIKRLEAPPFLMISWCVCCSCCCK